MNKNKTRRRKESKKKTQFLNKIYDLLIIRNVNNILQLYFLSSMTVNPLLLDVQNVATYVYKCA